MILNTSIVYERNNVGLQMHGQISQNRLRRAVALVDYSPGEIDDRGQNKDRHPSVAGGCY